VTRRRCGIREGWGFRFPNFQTSLAEVGSFLRVHARLKVRFFQKVAPTGVPVFRALCPFELDNRGLSLIFSPNHGHDTAGLIGSDIVSNNGVGSFGVVPRQRHTTNN
jgi:hypothetical protein